MNSLQKRYKPWENFPIGWRVMVQDRSAYFRFRPVPVCRAALILAVLMGCGVVAFSSRFLQQRPAFHLLTRVLRVGCTVADTV